ncbi:hypothetical protein [Listeria grandensis]|uniref:hypothetical protein n=1 Tax=Listeria grandensis TaxID=1494963 RepID=UPI0015672A08|nr:hypothetical protein [Listeria grandensis]
MTDLQNIKKKLTIENGEVYDEAKQPISREFYFDKTNEKKREIKLKPRKTYFLYVFYLLCTILFAACLGVLLMINNEDEKPTSKKGTYRLAALYSSNASLYNDNESINTLLVQSATKFNKSKFFNEEKRINEDEYLEQAIALKNSTYKNLFYLELYDPSSKEFMDIKELMIDELRRYLKLGEDTELIIDDGAYFKK